MERYMRTGIHGNMTVPVHGQVHVDRYTDRRWIYSCSQRCQCFHLDPLHDLQLEILHPLVLPLHGKDFQDINQTSDSRRGVLLLCDAGFLLPDVNVADPGSKVLRLLTIILTRSFTWKHFTSLHRNLLYL